MKRLRKFLCLSSTDRRLLARAALLLGAIRLGLWMVPFQTLRRFLARVTHLPTASHSADQSSPDRIAWAVAVASRYVLGTGTCLTRALAAQVLLARGGHPASLRIGVARSGEGRFEAHAWVESQGRIVVGGGELAYYTPLTGWGKK